MKRAVCALSLALSLVLGLAVPAAAAEPDPVTQTLRTLEIMVGDETGDLHLDRPVTRAEFAKLLVAASDQSDAVSGQGAGYSLFTDVKSGHWASEYIKLCLDQGWMIGYTDGSFRPDNTVTLEEACTACLRLLGYDSAALSGSFPAAQLSKAAALGLRDDLAAVQGAPLTREDCARIFYNLLTAKTAQGQVYAVTLGYSLDADGAVDYLAAAREDWTGPVVWTAQSALDFTPTAVYLNDRLVEAYTPAAGDVCYYNAGLGILWVYTDQVFGQITALSPTVGRPETVSVDGKNYTLGTDAVKAKLAELGDSAAGSLVTLYLGENGAVADAETVIGPLVAGASTRLPFTPQTVYRDGVSGASAGLNANDVYYYSTQRSTLWVYTDQVSGRIEALSPSALSPTAVTVSGVSYPLASEALGRELSSLNGKWTGQFVTLLLGMDGSVVKVLSGEAVNADYYGVVHSAVKTAVDGAVEQTVTVLCTDGAQHVFPVSAEAEVDAGDLVRVSVSGEAATVSALTSVSLSGTVNQAGTRIGTTPLAADAEIIDISEDGGAVSVEPGDLSGLTLSTSDVRFYTQNDQGQIDRLILRDATGKLWSYGFVSQIETVGAGMNVTNRYTLLTGGQTQVLQAAGKSYPVTAKSGVAVRRDTDGAVASMKALSSIRLTSLGKTSAYAASRTFQLAEDVQVWLKDDGAYYPAELSDVDAQRFELTGWYDTLRQQVRVIVAEEL